MHGAEKRVPGPGGVYSFNVVGGQQAASGVAQIEGALWPTGDQDNGRAYSGKKRGPSFKTGFAGQERHLLFRNFKKIRLGEQLCYFRFCFIRIIPEKRPVVGIKTDDLFPLFRKGKRLVHGASARIAGKGDRSEMEDLRARDKFLF
jgi:hypothetical protein